MSLGISEFIRHNLMPGERVVAITRIHPMRLVAASILPVLGLLLGLVGIVAGGPGIALAVISIPLALLGSIHVLILFMERLTTEFSCTDRRILIKSGLLTTHLREMPLTKVESLRVVQGLFGKLFGYGTLVVTGSGGTPRRCKNIDELFEFYKRVQEQVALAQKHN